MTTPALLRLREKFPGAHIALLTPEKLRELWLHHPAVDEIISFAPGENVFCRREKTARRKFRSRAGAAQFAAFGAGSLAGGNSATHRLRASVAEFFPDASRRAARRRRENAETFGRRKSTDS
jgi:hypothetical protein